MSKLLLLISVALISCSPITECEETEKIVYDTIYIDTIYVDTTIIIKDTVYLDTLIITEPEKKYNQTIFSIQNFKYIRSVNAYYKVPQLNIDYRLNVTNNYYYFINDDYKMISIKE